MFPSNLTKSILVLLFMNKPTIIQCQALSIRTWKLNIVESWTLFLFCMLVGFYLMLLSYGCNYTHLTPASLCVCIVIIFLQLWHKFWPCNTYFCHELQEESKTEARSWWSTVYSSGMTKSCDMSQLVTLLSPDCNKQGDTKRCLYVSS